MNYTRDAQTTIAADLDGTLAVSKSPLSEEMSATISKWLESNSFAIISGGGYEQFRKQIINELPSSARLENLILFPTNGAACYQYQDNQWELIYQETLTEEERDKITGALQLAMIRSEVDFPEQFGRQAEYRGGQIAFSALGQEAPLEKKSKWDPDQAKRKRIVAELLPLLPEFQISIGGTTTIDITRKGIDKSYAIEKLKTLLNIDSGHIIFLGDAIFEGGNDFSATKTGVQCIKVTDPAESQKIIEELLTK